MKWHRRLNLELGRMGYGSMESLTLRMPHSANAASPIWPHFQNGGNLTPELLLPTKWSSDENIA